MSLTLDTLRPPNPHNISETGLPYNQGGRRRCGTETRETDANVAEELAETTISQCPAISHLNSL